MGRRLGGYRDMTKGKKAAFLDAWKEKGFISVWLHREPPWERIIHSFRKVEKYETKGGLAAKIKWLPFTCWEDDSYHRSRRFDDHPRHAEHCPMDRFLEWLEAREDLPSDAPIFQFVAGRENRNLLKDDLLGQGDGWRDDATGRTEFVLAVIPNDNPVEVMLTNEKWSLGQALIKRIQIDCEQLGEDKGDPERAPICYNFEYDSERNSYNVTRFAEAELTPEIQALWEGPAPDAAPFIKGSNPKDLLTVMQDHCLLEDVPWDDLFGPAIQVWGDRDEGEATFDPEQIEAEAKAAGEKAEGAKAAKPAKPPEKPKKEKKASKGNGASAKGAKPADKPKRPTRQVQVPEPEVPEPDPDPEVQVFECGACGGDWPENLPKCPQCGAVDAGAEAPEAPTAEAVDTTAASDIKF